MSAADAAALKKANQSSGFLNWIEKVGNKVPDPTIMFLYLIAFIAVLSWILSWIGVSVTDQVATPVSTGEFEQLNNQFGSHWMIYDTSTGEPAVMWGDAIVGFGRYAQSDAKGQPLDWPVVGFSPRKANMVLYLMNGFDGSAALLDRLGPHRTGGSCLYLTTLDKADLGVLRTLAEQSVAHMRAKYPG